MGLVKLGTFESKSIFSEGKFTVVAAEYSSYADFNGDIKPGFFIHLTQIPDSAPDKVDHQWISAGKLDFTAPSKDGKTFVDLEAADLKDRGGPFAKTTAENSTGIPQNTNAEFWYKHLLAAEFDTTRLDADINKTLAGMVYYAITVDQPKRDMKDRKGYARKKNEDGSEKEPTIKVPDKIFGYDGDTSSAPAGAVDYTQLLIDFLTEELASGPVTLPNLNGAMIKGNTGRTLVTGGTDKENSNAMAGLMGLCTEDWLNSSKAFTFTPEGKMVSMA